MTAHLWCGARGQSFACCCTLNTSGRAAMAQDPYKSFDENPAQQPGVEIPSFTFAPNDGQQPPQMNGDGPAQESSFDLDSLRLPQDFGSIIGVQRLLTTVPVRKPHRQEFVRVHADERWRMQTAVLEVKETRETYLVDRSLWSDLLGEPIPKMLFTTINRQGTVFLWPIRLPGEDSRLDPWSQSALEGAHLAMHGWVRVSANQSLGAYEIFRANGLLDDPPWPKTDFHMIVQIAFKNRFIKSLDHPELRRLRGEL
jgi:hypothetical protein